VYTLAQVYGIRHVQLSWQLCIRIEVQCQQSFCDGVAINISYEKRLSGCSADIYAV